MSLENHPLEQGAGRLEGSMPLLQACTRSLDLDACSTRVQHVIRNATFEDSGKSCSFQSLPLIPPRGGSRTVLSNYRKEQERQQGGSVGRGERTVSGGEFEWKFNLTNLTSQILCFIIQEQE